MRPLFPKSLPSSSGGVSPDEILADSVSVLGSSYGEESKMERSLGRSPYFLFLGIMGAGAAYLLLQAGFLEIAQGEKFFAASEENRFLTRPIFSQRGMIYDRNGEALVENRPSFGILFEKEKFFNEQGDVLQLLGKLSEILRKPREFFYEAGFPEKGDLDSLPQQFVVMQDAAPEEVMALAARSEFLPGIQIFESFRRQYRDPYAMSHLLGFLGKISAEDLHTRPELRREEMIGKNGVEAFYDESLRGRAGRKIVETDALGRETRFKLVEEPQAGSNLRLTLDGQLQKVSYETVKNYTGENHGASVVILDPRDGAVLSLVSFPGFDSNSFGYSLSRKDFENIVRSPLKPFFNRAVSGEFPSGSTIKPLIAAAALEEKIIEPEERIYDEGYIAIPNPYRPGEETRFLDWKKHGWINLYDALAQSANVYFYMIGGGYRDQKGLGIERIKKYAAAFGLGSRLGIDIPGEKEGFIPDPESKKILEPEDPVWRVGDTYNVSIGQGGVKVTPLQMASLTAALANGGKLFRPHVLEAVLDERGNIVRKVTPEILRENIISQESLRRVVKGMRQTVTSGTARLLSGLPVAAAAKTGTAQVGNKPPHAWVTVFAPLENPEIAITVMVEHAGEGATAAVPITRDILQWYFQNR